MSGYVDYLLSKYQDKYDKCVKHKFTEDLCHGSISDAKLYTYLIQDQKYFKIGLNLFGKTLALCDNEKSSLVLGKQIGFICNDENDYFEKSLGEIRSASMDLLESLCPKMLAEEPELPEVKEYLDFLNSLVHESCSYVEVITLMYVMEQVYLGWAEPYSGKEDTSKLQYKHREWIYLHSGESFSKWVQFLKQEVERSINTEKDKNICEQTFLKTLDLEFSFFDACYFYQE